MTMECRDVRPLTEAYLSEQLMIETMQAIVAHLARCSACRAEVDGLRRLRAATRAAVAGSADLDARPEFLATLGARVQADAARRGPAARPRRIWLAIAAGLLLTVAAGAGWRQWSITSLTALLEAAVGDHRFCALTFKLAEAPITLEEAARRYDVVNRALEAVEPSADPLSGGPLRVLERHSCVFDGRRFAHIVLRYKGQAVSLLVADAADQGARIWGIGPADDGAAVSLPVTDGFQVAAFRQSRHMVLVVSSLGQDDVADVARAMAGPVTRALAGV
jgi:hypothetical protein